MSMTEKENIVSTIIYNQKDEWNIIYGTHSKLLLLYGKKCVDDLYSTVRGHFVH